MAELKGSLAGSSLLLDLSKGDVSEGLDGSAEKVKGGFVGHTSMLKITMTEDGTHAQEVEVDMVSVLLTLYRDISPLSTDCFA